MQTLRHMIETQEAAERGEMIQQWDSNAVEWIDDPHPTWDWLHKCFHVKPKPPTPAPLELHANIYPDGSAYGHIEREKAEEMTHDSARYGLFREVVPTPEPTSEPPAVEKRKPREWRVNRRPDGHVWLNPTNTEAKDHPCAEGALVREVLEGDHS